MSAQPAARGDDPFGLHLDVPGTAARGLERPSTALPYAGQIQAAFGDHDVSHVRAHTGDAASTAAASIGAEAYAMGDQVAFGRTPDLHTAAHEAAHVVQQRGGVHLKGGVGEEGDAHERHADAVADRVVAGRSAVDLLDGYRGGRGAAPGVQMRRMPANVDAFLTAPAGGPAANADAATEGLVLLLTRAISELTPDEAKAARTAMLGGMGLSFFSLPVDEILKRAHKAILGVRPDLTFGDPALYDIGPRTGTDDATNIKKLVKNTRKILNEIIGGKHDKDLADVFGKKHIESARNKYERARNWMMRFEREGNIHSDRSGHSSEVGMGGLTSFMGQIGLNPKFIDNPDEPKSIVVMIHEACHAGTEKVNDKGYIGTEGFDKLPTETKLTNAAHFEVVPRRILGLDPTYAGVVFTPAGVGGAAPMSDVEKALRAASETFRNAWTGALRLDEVLRYIHAVPTSWTTEPEYPTSIPFWSKVTKMTIHKKTTIDPASADPAKHPVSQIDLALSEGTTRRLNQCMKKIPKDDADVAAFEDARSTADERTAAHASVDTHRDFLLKLVLLEPGIAPITGDIDRDMRVTGELAAGSDSLTSPRPPGGFPD